MKMNRFLSEINKFNNSPLGVLEEVSHEDSEQTSVASSRSGGVVNPMQAASKSTPREERKVAAAVGSSRRGERPEPREVVLEEVSHEGSEQTSVASSRSGGVVNPMQAASKSTPRAERKVAAAVGSSRRGERPEPREVSWGVQNVSSDVELNGKPTYHCQRSLSSDAFDNSSDNDNAFITDRTSSQGGRGNLNELMSYLRHEDDHGGSAVGSRGERARFRQASPVSSEGSVEGQLMGDVDIGDVGTSIRESESLFHGEDLDNMSMIDFNFEHDPSPRNSNISLRDTHTTANNPTFHL